MHSCVYIAGIRRSRRVSRDGCIERKAELILRQAQDDGFFERGVLGSRWEVQLPGQVRSQVQLGNEGDKSQGRQRLSSLPVTKDQAGAAGVDEAGTGGELLLPVVEAGLLEDEVDGVGRAPFGDETGVVPEVVVAEVEDGLGVLLVEAGVDPVDAGVEVGVETGGGVGRGVAGRRWRRARRRFRG